MYSYFLFLLKENQTDSKLKEKDFQKQKLNESKKIKAILVCERKLFEINETGYLVRDPNLRLLAGYPLFEKKQTNLI